MTKRSVAWCLVVILMLTAIPFTGHGVSVASTNDLGKFDYYRYFSGDTDKHWLMTWHDFKTQFHVPMEVHWQNKDGMPFNTEIWFDKQLVVYGYYEYVRDNDFKNGTLKDFPSTGDRTIGHVNRGYYERNGQRGEYRYHGYDAQGNRYPNKDFPLDKDSGKLPEQRHYIYRIWDDTTLYHRNPNTNVPRIGKASEYNRIAIEGEQGEVETVRTRQWIDQTLPFNVVYGTHSDKKAYNYAHVLTRPTTFFPGQVVMWHDPEPHLQKGQNKTLWYVNYTLDRVESKEPTEVKAYTRIVDRKLSVSKEELDKKASITFGVRVTGDLLDTHLWDNVNDPMVPDVVKRGVYYNREDIQKWDIELTDSITKVKRTVEGRRPAANRGTSDFEVTLTYDQYKPYLSDKNELDIRFDGKATVHFHNKATAFGTAFDETKVKGPTTTKGDHGALSILKTWSDDSDKEAEFILLKGAAEVKRGFTEGGVLTWDDLTPDTYTLKEVTPMGYTSSLGEGESVTIKKSQVVMKNVVNAKNAVPEPPEVFDPLLIDVEAPNEMLDTERFAIRDKTELFDGFTRTIVLDGQPLSGAEADAFISGQHLFPLIGQDEIYNYEIIYDTGKGIEVVYQNYVVVYSTKPRAQMKVTGTFKENRLIEAITDVPSVNSAYLKANASIDVLSFGAKNLGGDDSLIKFGTKNDQKLAYIVKGEAAIEMNMQVKTTVHPSKMQRSVPSDYHLSDVYKYNLFVLKDYEPAMIANIWNFVMTREETLNMFYEASSYDDDLISVNTYEIYYDTTGDDEPDTLIESGNWSDYTDFAPDKLGQYKIVFYAEETFGQPTLEQFITDDDLKRMTVERPFRVDNLAPMTLIYTDIKQELPKADIMVLNDEAIDRERNTDIVGGRVDWMNLLRQSGVHGNVSVWDLHTYVHSQVVSTTRHTGGSYPSETTFYSSGGWTGTINRYNVVNNPYQQDDGWFETRTRTETRTFSVPWSNTVTNYRDGSSSQSNPAPSSIPISGDGFSGTMTRDGPGSANIQHFSEGPISSIQEWSVTFSGTGTRTVQEQVWRSNWQWYDSYTGYYSGTVYKHIKQSFSPSFRTESEKYIVYFADERINNPSDVAFIQSRGKSKVILVGKESAKPGLAHAHFVNADQPLEAIIKAVSDIITQENAVNLHETILVGETFTLYTVDIDDEKDPLDLYGYKYVHDPNYYDNSQGQEPGSGPSFESAPYVQTVKDRFTKVGKYTVYRQIKDHPVGQPEYAKESNLAKIDILVHRKPIADFTLDWDYDANLGAYKTTWVDLSYDLDHQFSDAEKGIRDRRIRYRKTSGDNQWIYSIPDKLTHGTYEVRYMVKDIEGVWSDERIRSYTLLPEPPMRLTAALKPESAALDLFAIPASEGILIYDLTTQYHRAHDVQLTLKGLKTEPVALYLYSEMGKYNKNENIHLWQDALYSLPETLKDGAYQVEVLAKATTSPRTELVLLLPFKVNTPISVKGQVPELVTGEWVAYHAEAGIYAKTVSVLAFVGTPYEVHYVLEKANGQWQVPALVPLGMAEGIYAFEFTAITASGKIAQDTVHQKVSHFGIEEVTIKGHWNHWRGQVDLMGNRKMNQPHRFLSHEKITIDVTTIGAPDSVWLSFSPELESMVFTDLKGHTHRHKDTFGSDVYFPLALEALGPNVWRISTILPFAPSSMTWEDDVIRAPYTLNIKAKKGEAERSASIEDLHITGNVYDLIHIQPKYGK